MNPTHYFLQENMQLNGPTQVGGYKISFDPVMFFGSGWWGIYETQDAAVIKALKATCGKKRGLSEISKEDYDKYVDQKKTGQPPPSSSIRIMNPVEQQRPGPPPPPMKPASRAPGSAAPLPQTTSDNPDSPPLQSKSYTMEEALQTAPRHNPSDADSQSASTSGPRLTSQRALAEALGISLPKVQDLLKAEGSPEKYSDGYDLEEFKLFIEGISVKPPATSPDDDNESEDED